MTLTTTDEIELNDTDEQELNETSVSGFTGAIVGVLSWIKTIF